MGDRTELRIGISPMSWGVRLGKNPRRVPWSRFLDEVAAAGYEGIEMGTWGYLPTDPVRLRKELDDRKLSLAAGQLNADFTNGADWSAVKARTAAVCDLLNEVGSARLVLLSTPSPPSPHQKMRPDQAMWSRMIERILEIARLARKRGIVAVYHPHAGGLIESEEEIERFLTDSESDQVSLCFDTAHHAYCGGDVTRFIKRHPDRIAHVHVKNFNEHVWAQVVKQGIPFVEALRLGVITDLESGLIDFIAVRDALQHVAFDGWAVVEQDMNPTSHDAPFTIAARNRQYLRKLNFG